MVFVHFLLQQHRIKTYFSQAQATTLYDFTIVFDSLDDNYHEFDRQKLLTLYDAIGIPENMQAAI